MPIVKMRILRDFGVFTEFEFYNKCKIKKIFYRNCKTWQYRNVWCLLKKM